MPLIRSSACAIIPLPVRRCKNLEPEAILLYAEFTVLNEFDSTYLQELFNVDEATINKWIDSLEKEGFIKIETSKDNLGTVLKTLIIQ